MTIRQEMAETGVEKSTEASSVLDSTVDGVNHINSMIVEIASITEKHSVKIDGINNKINDISVTMNTTLESAKISSSSSSALSRISNNIKDITERFKV